MAERLVEPAVVNAYSSLSSPPQDEKTAVGRAARGTTDLANVGGHVGGKVGAVVGSLVGAAVGAVGGALVGAVGGAISGAIGGAIHGAKLERAHPEAHP